MKSCLLSNRFRSLNFSLCPSIIQILSFLCNSHTAFPAFFSMNLKPFSLRSSQYVHFTQNNPHGVEPAYAFPRGLAGFYFTCVQIGIHVIMIPAKQTRIFPLLSEKKMNYRKKYNGGRRKQIGILIIKANSASLSDVSVLRIFTE